MTINGTRTRAMVEQVQAIDKAMVEQVQAIDKAKLKDKLGSLAGETVMGLIDEQLRYLLALDYSFGWRLPSERGLRTRDSRPRRQSAATKT